MSIFLLLKRLGQNQDGSWFGWLWDLMQDLPNISHDPERIGARSPHFADRELTGAELRGPGCPVPLQDRSRFANSNCGANTKIGVILGQTFTDLGGYSEATRQGPQEAPPQLMGTCAHGHPLGIIGVE